MPLSSRQRAELRSRANALKPVVQIGKEGLSDAAIQSVRDAFNTRDLAKVKVQEMAPVTARDAAYALAEAIERMEVVQVMGRIATLYRPLEKQG